MKDSELKTSQSMSDINDDEVNDIDEKEEYDTYDKDDDDSGEESGEIYEEEVKLGWGAKDNEIELTESEILEYNMEEERRVKRKEEEERKRIKRENKTINYVDSDRMLELIRDYYETDKMSDELALDIKKICDRLMTSSRFCNYTYRDEMAADAFVKAYEAIYYKKFSVDKGYSPFSYLTQIAFHAAQARIKKEKKERLKYTMYVDDNYDRIKMENSGVELEDEEWD